MLIKEKFNRDLSKIFKNTPLPTLSKSGYLAMVKDEEIVKIILDERFASPNPYEKESCVIENCCRVTAGRYTVIFPMSRDDFQKILKEKGIIRYGRLEINKLIEFLKDYIGRINKEG